MNNETKIGKYTMGEIENAQNVIRETLIFIQDNVDTEDKELFDTLSCATAMMMIDSIITNNIRQSIAKRMIVNMEAKKKESEATKVTPMAQFTKSNLQS